MNKTTSEDTNKNIATRHNIKPMHIIHLNHSLLYSFLIHYCIRFFDKLHILSDIFHIDFSTPAKNQHILTCENDVKHAKTSSFDESNTLILSTVPCLHTTIVYFHVFSLSRKQMGVISLFYVLLLTFTRLNVTTRF